MILIPSLSNPKIFIACGVEANSQLQLYFLFLFQLKVAQGVDYKLEESMTMETELIELRAERSMMALQVGVYKKRLCYSSLVPSLSNPHIL